MKIRDFNEIELSFTVMENTGSLHCTPHTHSGTVRLKLSNFDAECVVVLQQDKTKLNIWDFRKMILDC